MFEVVRDRVPAQGRWFPVHERLEKLAKLFPLSPFGPSFPLRRLLLPNKGYHVPALDLV